MFSSRLPAVGPRLRCQAVIFFKSSLCAASAPPKSGLREQLKSNLLSAMKSKDAARATVIRGVLSDLKYADMNAGPAKQINEMDLIQLLHRAIKKREDSIEQFRSAGRTDLTEAELEELRILESFVPKPLSRSEVQAICRRAISDSGAKSASDFGRVMRLLTDAATSPLDLTRAPKKLISDVVKELLPATSDK